VALLTTGNYANPQIVTSADTLRGSTINVNTSGQQGGYAQCIRVAGSNRVSVQDTNLFLTATNCSGSAKLIGCETPSNSSYLDLRNCIVSASSDATSIANCSLAEISQTNASSEIILSYTRLQYHHANTLGFTPAQIPTNITFGIYDTNQWTEAEIERAYYLLPGTILRASAPTLTTSAAPFIIEQDCILRGVFLSANAPLTTGTMTMNVYHSTVVPSNIVFTLSIGGAIKSAVNNTKSYTFQNGDYMYVTLCGGGATSASPALRSFQANIGLF
jgi:hypothetical protein